MTNIKVGHYESDKFVVHAAFGEDKAHAEYIFEQTTKLTNFHSGCTKLVMIDWDSQVVIKSRAIVDGKIVSKAVALVDFVCNIPVPRNYRDQWFMDMYFPPEPIGVDPATGSKICFGEGSVLCCGVDEQPWLYPDF